MNVHMSTPGNTARLGTVHSNIQTAQSCPYLDGIEPTMHIIQHNTESALYPTMPARHKVPNKVRFPNKVSSVAKYALPPKGGRFCEKNFLHDIRFMLYVNPVYHQLTLCDLGERISSV